MMTSCGGGLLFTACMCVLGLAANGFPVEEIYKWEQAIPEQYRRVIDKLTALEEKRGNHPKRDPWFTDKAPEEKRARARAISAHPKRFDDTTTERQQSNFWADKRRGSPLTDGGNHPKRAEQLTDYYTRSTNITPQESNEPTERDWLDKIDSMFHKSTDY